MKAKIIVITTKENEFLGIVETKLDDLGRLTQKFREKCQKVLEKEFDRPVQINDIIYDIKTGRVIGKISFYAGSDEQDSFNDIVYFKETKIQ